MARKRADSWQAGDGVRRPPDLLSCGLPHERSPSSGSAQPEPIPLPHTHFLGASFALHRTTQAGWCTQGSVYGMPDRLGTAPFQRRSFACQQRSQSHRSRWPDCTLSRLHPRWSGDRGGPSLSRFPAVVSHPAQGLSQWVGRRTPSVGPHLARVRPLGRPTL